jgi:hypothetical protein
MGYDQIILLLCRQLYYETNATWTDQIGVKRCQAAGRPGRTVLNLLFAIVKASTLRQHSSVTHTSVGASEAASADRVRARGSVENGAFLAMKHTFHIAAPTISELPDRTT